MQLTVQINNSVDGDNIPVPHFGVILDFQEFDALAERLRKNNQEFIVEPRTRFKGESWRTKNYVYMRS